MKRFTETCAAVALVALVAGACGKDRDLAERPNASGGTGTGGAGGAGGSRGGRGGSAGSAPTGGVGGKFTEPRGRSVTSFFHGIVDAERVLYCFARHDEADAVLVGDPRPSGGLAYAASIALETIDGVDLETTPVLPYVIAGELALVDGMNCERAVDKARQEMDAVATNALGAGGAGGEPGHGGNGGEPEPPTPPRLRVAALPEIPEGALAEGYSSLYVAIGCLGGPAFTHTLEDDACGRGYGPNAPTVSAALVTLSRTHVTGKLTLQALHASLASPTVTVSSAPPDIAVQASVPVAYDLRRGELKPRQPSPQLTILDYGLASPGWRAQALTNGTPLVSELWVDVLERAGIDAFVEGRGYTIVVVGPAGNVGFRGFWNSAALGVVDNDPEI